MHTFSGLLHSQAQRPDQDIFEERIISLLMGALLAGTQDRLVKHVKGLLNRLAEANVQPSVEEAAGLLQSEGRRPAMSALTQELLQVRL